MPIVKMQITSSLMFRDSLMASALFKRLVFRLGSSAAQTSMGDAGTFAVGTRQSWRADCPAITALRATKQRQQETDLQSAGVAAIAGLFVFLLPVALSASIGIFRIEACPVASSKPVTAGSLRTAPRRMTDARRIDLLSIDGLKKSIK